MGKQTNRERNRLSQNDQTAKRIERAEKALKKQAEPKFWDKWGEPMACGLIGFLFVSLIYYSWTGNKMNLSEVRVNDETRINFINTRAPGFILGQNDFFEGRTLQEVQDMSNNLLAQDRKLGKCAWTTAENVELESEYNFHKRFPNCRSKIQASFGVSLGYVELVSAVFEERECVESSGSSQFVPSVLHMVACDRKNMGEKGGAVKESLEFIRDEGVTDSSCFSGLDLNMKDCPPAKDLETCPKKKLQNFCMLGSKEDIKREIQNNGPVLAVIPPYLNFLTFKSGIIKLEENSRKVNGHLAVKIVGWETTSKGEHWVVDPLFGESYGEDGYAHISMDHHEEFGSFGFGIRLLQETTTSKEA